MSNFLQSWLAHLPGWAAAAVLVGGGLIWALSKLGPALGASKWVPGWLRRRRNQKKADRVDAELGDLRRQVEFLTRQIEELRTRDEMYWSWILMDQEWHRRYEFECVKAGVQTVPHVPFMEFRDGWLLNRKFREENPF